MGNGQNEMDLTLSPIISPKNSFAIKVDPDHVAPVGAA